MSEATIYVDWTDNVKVSFEKVDEAILALQNVIEELGKNSFFDVERGKEISANWDSCTEYDDYLNKYKDYRSENSGDAHVLLYYEGLVEGFSFTDNLAAGKSVSNRLTSSESIFAVVNSDLQEYSNIIYSNFVKHEFLHGLLDSGPDSGNEHSNGRQVGFLDEISPMLTGYAEPIRGGNDKPDQICNRDTVATSLTHDQFISGCTKDRASGWLDDNY